MFTKLAVDVLLPLVPLTKTMSRPSASFEIAFLSSARITRPVTVSPRPRLSTRDARPDKCPIEQAMLSRVEMVTISARGNLLYEFAAVVLED